MTSAFIDL